MFSIHTVLVMREVGGACMLTPNGLMTSQSLIYRVALLTSETCSTLLITLIHILQ